MDLGARFWLAVLGIAIGGFIGFVLVLWLVGWAWYTWGFLGGMAFIIGVLLLVGWISDIRERKRYEGFSE